MPLEQVLNLVLFPQESEEELLVVPRSFLGHFILKVNTVSLVVELFDVLQILLSPCNNHTA